MSIMEIEIFLLVFFVAYLTSALAVFVVHLVSGKELQNVRVPTIIFSLLVALAVTLLNVGR